MPKNQECRLGKWKKTEHDRFIKALSKYGKNWSLIQKAVKTRTLAQVRSHSQKLFLSMTDKQINLFEEQLSRRFDSFCSSKKQRESLKTGQKSSLKEEEDEAQQQRIFDSCGKSNEDLNRHLNMEKINEQQKNAIQDSKEPKKQGLKGQYSVSSSSTINLSRTICQYQSANQKLGVNYMMYSYPQIAPESFGNFQYIFWLPC